MSSPEHTFRLSEFRAPEKTGGESSGSTGHKNPQLNPLPDSSLSESNLPIPAQEKFITNLVETRRTLEEQPGYIPPLAGGAPRKIPLSPEELVSLHREQHVPVSELAERFNVSETTVYKILDAGGFNKEARLQRLEEKGYISPAEGGAPIKVTVTPEELVALHYEQGIPVDELAKRFNVHRWTIYRKLRKGGMSANKG